MSILPQHVAYPRVFVSQQIYCQKDGKWVVDEEHSDPSLNRLLADFVESTGAAITSISPPNVNIWEDKQDRRVYMTSVSVLYIPAAEGVDDAEAGEG